MVYDGPLTHAQGLELLHRLVEQNADARPSLITRLTDIREQVGLSR
jgi:hypothetical protein